MTLESIAIGGSFVLYLIVGLSYLIKKEYAWAMIWLSYATANIGLIWAGSHR